MQRYLYPISVPSWVFTIYKINALKSSLYLMIQFFDCSKEEKFLKALWERDPLENMMGIAGENPGNQYFS